MTGSSIFGNVEGEGTASVTLTLNLSPEVSQGLAARARARGVSLDENADRGSQYVSVITSAPSVRGQCGYLVWFQPIQ